MSHFCIILFCLFCYARAGENFDEMKNQRHRDNGFPAKDFDSLFATLPRVPSGEDAYTIMNSAAAAAAAKEQSCNSLPRNGDVSLSTTGAGDDHSSLRPSLSLPLVSQRLTRQESEPSGDTPEERYVRRSLLV